MPGVVEKVAQARVVAHGVNGTARGTSAGRSVHADAAPQHVSFGSGLAFVTSGAAGTVAVHALDDAAVHRRTRVPVGSYNVQRSGGRWSPRR